MIRIAHCVEYLLNGKFRCIFRLLILDIQGELFRLFQCFPVWIDLHKRLKILCSFQLRKRIFQLNLIFGKILVSYTVDVIFRSCNTYELHLYYHFCITPPV